MKRRTFLRIGALAPAVLALEQLPLLARAAPAAGTKTSLLDPREREVLLAVIERMVDTGRADAPTPADVGAVERVERLFSQLDPELVDAFRWALWLIDLWPLLELRFERFRSLEVGDRDASLEGWRRSRLDFRRQIFDALRTISLLAYWSDEATWPLIGYPGPWIRR